MEEELNYGFEDAVQPRFDPSMMGEDFGGRVDWDRVGQIVGLVQRVQAYKAQQDEAARKAERDATRFAAQEEFNELIKGGASPVEAYRRVAPKLHFDNPKDYVDAYTKLNPQKPTIENIEGRDFVNWGDGKYSFPPPKPVSQEFKPSPADKFTHESDYRSALKQFETAKKGTQKGGETVTDPMAIADAARRLRLSEQNLKGLYSPKSEPDEKIIVTKDGKKFRLPKSQLEQAKSQGYELVE